MRRAKALLGVVILSSIALGCGTEPTKPPPEPQVGYLPDASTPQNAILRLNDAYEQKNDAAYAGMFTKDFTYDFSNSTDPDLVTKYSTGWFAADEVTASAHLFHGFTPAGSSVARPGAQSIDISLASTLPGDDLASPDPETHKVLFTRVDGSIVVPPGQGETDNTTYVITNNQNVFYIVRGDAAAALDGGQPADDKHWYIYRWVDLTVQTVQGAPNRSPMPAQSTTWGSVKASFR